MTLREILAVILTNEDNSLTDVNLDAEVRLSIGTEGTQVPVVDVILGDDGEIILADVAQ